MVLPVNIDRDKCCFYNYTGYACFIKSEQNNCLCRHSYICVSDRATGDELMSRKWRNILIGVLVAALVIGGIWLLSRSENNFRSKYEGADLSTDITGIGRSNTYNAYVAQYKDLPAVTDTVEVELASFEGEGGEVCADGVLTADESELTWKVNMPKAGLYNIHPSGLFALSC